MGRQIAIAMELKDEEAFLAFLRASADIAVYRSWSPRPESIPTFTSDAAASPFYLHNRSFKWEPRFELVHYEDRVNERQSSYYRLIGTRAPVIEYSRHPLAATDPQVSGRLYWSKVFVSQPDEIKYDFAAFDAWFSSIVRWVRQHGRKLGHGSTEPWCLPGAQQRLQNGL